MNTFGWLVRREIWEHRGSLLRAPVISMVIFVILALLALPLGQNHFHQMSPVILGHTAEGVEGMLTGALVLTAMIMSISMFFYAAGSLYDDRRDRSVLFWKSLPVSDFQTVLSKAFVPLIVAPFLAVIIGLTGGLVISTLAWIILTLAHGSLVGMNLNNIHLGNIMVNLISLWFFYILSALPTIGWLMACSAWARSKPLLWALLLPLGLWMMWGWVSLMGVNLPSISPFIQEILGGLWNPVTHLNHDGSGISSLFQQRLLWGALLGVGFLGLAVIGRRHSLDT